jgi:hypothetical protein
MRKKGAHFKGKRQAADPLAFAHAIAMQHGMSGDQLADLGMAVYQSIERLRVGLGGDSDWHTLVGAVDVSLVLCEWGYGPEHLDTVKTAQDALIHIHQRKLRTGRMAFDGAAYTAITAAIGLHEAQIEATPRIVAREAVREVSRRMAVEGVRLAVEGAAMDARVRGALREAA